MKGIRMFRTIQMKLIIIYVLLILFAMQLIGIYFVKTMENSFVSNFTSSLNKQASVLADLVEPILEAGNTADKQSTGDPKDNGGGKKPYADLNEYVSNWYKVSKADIQIIDANGLVLSTSQSNAQNIVGQKNTHTIVTRALQNIKETDNQSDQLDADGKRMKAIAKPVGSGGKVVGVVYMEASMEETYDTISRINRIFLSGILIALALTAALGVILSGTITNPIKEITRQVAAVAEGNFDKRVEVFSHDEIGQLSGAFNHMTQRLKEALSLNEEEKEKLASILTNMSDGVIATDAAGTVILINRRAKQMLQLKEREALGRNVRRILPVGEEDMMVLEHREETRRLIQLEVQPEEEPLKVQLTFTPIYRREKGYAGMIVVLHDVTEQEALEQARREFVANVSHELRTPLTTIKSYLEALEDGALEEPQLAQRFVGVTRNETERMIRLVTDLLHLSRLDSKQAQLTKEWTQVDEMLEEVADRFSFQVLQRGITIHKWVQADMEPILLDRDKIDQVLDNLVSNAIKYSADNGRIMLTARRLDRHTTEFTVEDNGIGIPKKDLDRIFERFYRVDKARSRNMGGTGLGLSIAREIVRAHGGTITIESEFNRGTKVLFTLPDTLPEGVEAE